MNHGFSTLVTLFKKIVEFSNMFAVRGKQDNRKDEKHRKSLPRDQLQKIYSLQHVPIQVSINIET